ncbi:MAG: hypothetical protein ACJAVI_002649, partial [Candidatus Azotimanducaceae bacterium]
MDKRQGKEFELETLEERILLSGDPLLDPIQALGPQQRDPSLENLSSPYGIDAVSIIEKLDQGASSSNSFSDERGHSDKVSYDPQAMLDDLFGGMSEDDFDEEAMPAAAAETTEQVLAEEDADTDTTTKILVAESLEGTLKIAEAGTHTAPIETDSDVKNISTYDYFGYSAPPADPSQTLEITQNSPVISLASDPVAESLRITHDLVLSNESASKNVEILIVSEGYELSGSGSFGFNLVNEGTLKPGNSPGILNPATFTNAAGATLVVEIGGLTPGPGTPIDNGYDQVNTSANTAGSITLDGTFEIQLINSFLPTVGQTFEILTFANGGSITGVFTDAIGLYGFGDGSLYFDLEEYANGDGTGGLRVIVKEVNGDNFTSSVEPVTLANQFGKFLSDYFTVDGSTDELSGFQIDIADFITVDTGNFGIQKVGNQLRFVSNGGSAHLKIGSFEIGITGADLVVVLNDDGTRAVGTANGTFQMVGGDMSGVGFAMATAASVDIQLNNTTTDYSVSNLEVEVGSLIATLDVGLAEQKFTATDVEVTLVNFATLTGDFSFQKSDGQITAVATNAAAELRAGNFAIGVSSASLALLLTSNNKLALRANGTASFIGDVVANATAASVTVAFNDTGIDFTGQSLIVDGNTALLDVAIGVKAVSMVGLDAEIGGFASFGGNFGFELDGTDIKVSASDAYAQAEAGNFRAGVTNGSLAMVLTSSNTLAMSVSGSVLFQGDNFANATATSVAVKFNDTGSDRNEFISINGVDATLDALDGVSSISITGLQADISGFLTFGGNFAFEQSGAEIRASATDVFARVEAGSFQAGVSAGSLALILNTSNEIALSVVGNNLIFQGGNFASASAVSISVNYNETATDFSTASQMINIDGISATLNAARGTASVLIDDLSVDISGFATLTGDFGFSLDGTSVIGVAGDVSVRMIAGGLTVGLDAGALGMEFFSDNTMVVEANGTLFITGGNFASASASKVLLQYNDTGLDYTGIALAVDSLDYLFEDMPASSDLTAVSVTGFEAEFADFISLSGNFSFSLTAGEIFVVANDVSALVVAGSFSAGVNNGELGLISKADGTQALEASGSLFVAGGDFAQVRADLVAVHFNTTNVTYTGTTIRAGELSYTYSDLAAATNLQVVSITGLQGNIGEFITFGGNFAFERIIGGGGAQVRAVADSAYAFMQAGDVRVGVENGSFALILNTDDTKALQASGALLLEGGEFASATATDITVNLNDSATDYSAAPVTLTIDGISADLASALNTESIAISGLAVEFAGVFNLTGNFAFSRSGTFPNSVIEVAASEVTAAVVAGGFSAGVQNGTLALILNDDNTAALTATGGLFFQGGGFASASASVIEVNFNTTAVDYEATPNTITVAGISEDVVAGLGVSSVTITGLDVQVGDFVTLTGNFGFSLDSNGRVLAIAEQAGASLTAGDFAIGFNNGALGLVLNTDGTKVIQASGAFFLTGGDFADIQATSIELSYNDTGIAYTGVALAIDDLNYTFTNIEAIDLQRVTVTGFSAEFGGFVSLSGNLFFERTVTGTDAKIIVAGTDVNAFVGAGAGTADATGVSISNVNLALVIYQDGVTSTSALSASGDASLVGITDLILDGQLHVRVNQTNGLVNEVVQFGDQEIAILFEAGEETLIQASGSVNVEVADFLAFSGNFAFEKTEVVTGTVSETVIRVAATQVAAFLGTGRRTLDATGVEISDGTFGLVINKSIDSVAVAGTAVASSYALTASGTASLVGVDELTLSGSLMARLNNTGGAVNQTISTLGGDVDIIFNEEEGNLQKLEGSIELDIAGFVGLDGEFSFEKSDVITGSVTETTISVAATNVNAFVGADRGTADAAGVEINNGELGLLLYQTLDSAAVEGSSASGTYAVSVSGDAALLGVPNVTASGSLEVLVNNTGGAISETLTTPGGTVSVEFTAEQGNYQRVEGSVQLAIAGFVSLSGEYSFDKTDAVTPGVGGTSSPVLANLLFDGGSATVSDELYQQLRNELATEQSRLRANGEILTSVEFTVGAAAFNEKHVDLDNDLITFTGEHGFADGQKITYSDGAGAAIGGLTDGVAYFVNVIEPNTLSISLTQGGAAIDLASDGTGLQQLIPVFDFDTENTLLVDIDANQINFVAAHGFSAGDQVRYATAANAEAIQGLSDGDSYFVLLTDVDTIQLSLTDGGPAVELTGEGSGDHSLDLVTSFDSSNDIVISITEDTIAFGAAHGFSENDRLLYSVSGGTAIGGLTDQTVYDVIVKDNKTIQLTNSSTGPPIDLTSDGTGTHNLAMVLTLEVGSVPVVDTVAETLTFRDKHYLTTEDTVIYQVIDGSKIGNLTKSSGIYYVIVVDDNTIQLASTKILARFGEDINLLNKGSGQQSLYKSTDTFLNETSITDITANVINLNVDHGLNEFQQVVLDVNAGTNPFVGLIADNTYWVHRVDNDSVQLAESRDDLIAGNYLTISLDGAAAATWRFRAIINFGTQEASTAIDTAAHTISFPSDHGFVAGEEVLYQLGTDPANLAVAGLTDGNTYFVVAVDADTFQLSATSGGAAIDLTSAGLGSQIFTSQVGLDFSATNTVHVDTQLNRILFDANHGLADGDQVTYGSQFNAGDEAIGGLVSGNQYFVRFVDAQTIELSISSGSTAISLTSAGVGEHQFAYSTVDFSSEGTIAVDTESDVINFAGADQIADGAEVTYEIGSGTAIGGLTSGTAYFVKAVGAGSLQLSENAGGVAIDLTSDGVGQHQLVLAGVEFDADDTLAQERQDNLIVLADRLSHDLGITVTLNAGAVTSTTNPAVLETAQQTTDSRNGSFSAVTATFTTAAQTETTITVAATSVAIFLGANEGTASEVGIKVSGAELGLLIFKTIDHTALSGSAAASTYALTASGAVALVGVPSLVLSGTLSARMNTTGGTVNRTLTTPGGTVDVVFDAGEENLQSFAGKNLTLDIAGFVTITGDIGFESTGLSPNTVIQIAGENIAASLNAGGFSVGVNNGMLALILNEDQTFALNASGSFFFTGGDFANATASTVSVAYNDTTTDYSVTPLVISIDGVTATVDAGLNTSSLSVVGLAIDIAGFVSFGGNFGFRITGADIEVAASDVFAQLEAGDFKVGVVNGNLAMLLAADGSTALTASGSFFFEGGDFANATATLVTVNLNDSATDYAATPLTIVIDGVSAELNAGLNVQSVSVVGLAVDIAGFVSIGGNFGFRITG